MIEILNNDPIPRRYDDKQSTESSNLITWSILWTEQQIQYGFKAATAEKPGFF